MWRTPQSRENGGGEYSDPEKIMARWNRGHQVESSEQATVSGSLPQAMPLLVKNVPNRVSRLKALGNAVLPQATEMLGRCIVSIERESQD